MAAVGLAQRLSYAQGECFGLDGPICHAFPGAQLHELPLCA